MMEAEQSLLDQQPSEKFAHALEMLGQVSYMEKEWLETENEHATHMLLTEGLPLLDHVIELFQSAHETPMALWTMLQKASLMVDLVKTQGEPPQSDFTRQAFELVRDSFFVLADTPLPTLQHTSTLYLLMIEIVLKIRAGFNDPEQLANLDELIQALSARLGEVLALDFSLRSQASDQLFTAQVIESLLPIEDNPQTRQEMLRASQNLALEAYKKYRFSSASNLVPVISLVETLANKQHHETSPAVIVCPQCGAENPIGMLFCGLCGTRLNKEDM